MGVPTVRDTLGGRAEEAAGEAPAEGPVLRGGVLMLRTGPIH